jgi:hypothetical protein
MRYQKNQQREREGIQASEAKAAVAYTTSIAFWLNTMTCITRYYFLFMFFIYYKWLHFRNMYDVTLYAFTFDDTFALRYVSIFKSIF